MVAEETKKTVDSRKDFSEMASLDPIIDEDQDQADDNSKDEHESSNIRSERKRNRERQRRSELSGAFDELAACIAQIDPERSPPAADDKKKRRKSANGGRGSDGEDASGITRLDLIGRAVQVMKTLHRENEERKRVIDQMRHQGGGAGGQGQRNDNVQALVMIPHLTPLTEDQPFPVARVAYPPGAQAGQMPQIASQHPDYLARVQQQGYGSTQWGNFPGAGQHMTRPVMHQGMHTWQQPQQPHQQMSNYAPHQPTNTSRAPNQLPESPQAVGRPDFV